VRLLRPLILLGLAAALAAPPGAFAAPKSRVKKKTRPPAEQESAEQPAPVDSAAAQARAAAALQAMESLAAQQKDADPRDRAALERKIEGYGAEFRSLGAGALGTLCKYVSEKDHPRKVRLYAAAFLGLIGDPGALETLKARLDDPEEGPGMRATALQAAGSLRLSVPARRALAEKAAFDPESPGAVVREALGLLAETSSDEVVKLRRAAKRYGASPRGVRALAARHAVNALSMSHKPAEEALLSLLRYFKKGSPLRADVLAALHGRKPKPQDLPSDGIDLIAACLFEETGPAAFEAARLLGDSADHRAAAPLIRALSLNDPAMLAEAAEALSKLGDASAAEPLAQLNGGLIRDARFAPRSDLDPRPYAVRIQKAAAFFAQLRRQSLLARSGKGPAAGRTPALAAAPAAAPSEVPNPAEAPLFRAHPPAQAPAQPIAQLSAQTTARAADISSDDEPPRAAQRPAVSKAAPPPEARPSPYFRYEGWPDAEPPRPTWAGRHGAITLRSAPDDGAPAAAVVALAKGRPIPVIDSVVVTLEPGRMRARGPVAFECRSLGLDRTPARALKRAEYEGPLHTRRLRLREGDTFEILAYRPQGACFLRRGGRLYLGECLPGGGNESFEMVADPKTRWWIKTGFAAGAKGWFSADDDGIEFER